MLYFVRVAINMQAFRAIRPLSQRVPTQTRGIASSKGIPQMLYNNVWKKSTVAYVTYIIVGCVAIEAVFGSVTQSIWDNANKGVSVAFLKLRWFSQPFLLCPHSSRQERS